MNAPAEIFTDKQLGDLASALVGQRVDVPAPAPATITIIVKGPNKFDVHVGETYHDNLCWDEMLGQVAALTLTGKERYPMLTPEQHEERRARWKRPSQEAKP